MSTTTSSHSSRPLAFFFLPDHCSCLFLNRAMKESHIKVTEWTQYDLILCSTWRFCPWMRSWWRLTPVKPLWISSSNLLPSAAPWKRASGTSSRRRNWTTTDWMRAPNASKGITTMVRSRQGQGCLQALFHAKSRSAQWFQDSLSWREMGDDHPSLLLLFPECENARKCHNFSRGVQLFLPVWMRDDEIFMFPGS